MITSLPSAPRATLIDPLNDRRWDAFVATHPQGQVFHTSLWAAVLMDTYGYVPRYHALEGEDGELVAAWPSMLVSSRVTGSRLVTLPFSDHCGPLVSDADQATRLLSALDDDRRRSGAGRIEVRGWPTSVPVPPSLTASHGYVRHEIDLSPGPEALLRNASESMRRSVRKGLQAGVTVRLAENRSDLDAFVQLNLRLRRRHGMLPQPDRFFEAIYHHLIASGHGYILLGELSGRPVAAVLCLRHLSVTLDKYAVSDDRFWASRPSHVVMWKSIEREAQRGALWYDMGRTDAAAAGLLRFKEQWRARRVEAPYYHLPAPGGLNTEDPRGLKKRMLSGFSRISPDPVYRTAGRILYRHLG